MLSRDIGIDLGTVNILIYSKGEGIILDEPSLVVIDEETKKVIAVGEEASKMLGRTPGKIKVIRPMKDGVIADFEMVEVLLNYLFKKINLKNKMIKPRIVICCPSNITKVEKNAIKEVAEQVGAKKVFVEEEPKVAALGAGLDIGKATGSMIVDIGGGTTDIAILSLGDIVTSSSIKVAGNLFDENIINYIKQKHKLLIGEKTAEKIKKEIGTAIPPQKKDKMDIKGRDLIGGLPKTITITNEEIELAIHDSIKKIINTIKEVLEVTPPELASDIIENGITITGGGALLKDLDIILKDELKVPIHIESEPLLSVVKGTGVLLEKINCVDK